MPKFKKNAKLVFTTLFTHFTSSHGPTACVGYIPVTKQVFGLSDCPLL